MSGEQIYKSNEMASEGSHELSLNTSTWMDGVYFVRLQIQDRVYTQKVIVTR
jgi:hypothetical protein